MALLCNKIAAVPKDFIIEQLQQRFVHHPHITREELLGFYRSFEPDLKDSTFAWRIHSLKAKNLLKPIRRGVYIFSAKPQFHPQVEPKLRAIARKLNKQFPVARHCVWSTRWLSEWMIHQPDRFLLLVEVEAVATESVFYFLKDEKYKNVYLNPDENTLERYINEERESIIVKPLITKAPLEKEEKVATPSLEKILVDIFVDRKLFSVCQGSELVQIFNTLDRMYALNITRMTAYAKRRGKMQELIDFMTKNTHVSAIPSK
ncbi:MAG: hypothetical protein HGA57_09875 [Chlorobium limicola]|uniref:Uncharacterized protein n=1 Tax=Chlorobium limicola (strain DSM 245 / NBRC 103803 / 6330) TaxID=290315 RepID=B3EE85_CHLL2|nr:conserved hypothetical protein [Chlorobium limicola DSM 245]NTV21669.1 hypothetical protein [Chlorobium limicola]